MAVQPVPATASPGAFRDVMASVCTPVSVVTTTARDGSPHGTTVSAFSSLSLDPPMVLVALDRASDLLALLRVTRRFGLNVLTTGQSGFAITLAGKGPGKSVGIEWDDEGGLPRLPGPGGFLACDVDRFVDGGDHVVVLGTVRSASAAAEPPLTYHGRSFGTHAALTTAADRRGAP